MGIFSRRAARKRRSEADARRKERWTNTQAIVHELFPVDRFPPLPANDPAPQEAPTVRIVRTGTSGGTSEPMLSRRTTSKAT